jgi:hypothetical protein
VRVLSPQTVVSATPTLPSLMPPKRGPGRPRKQPISEAVSKKRKNAPGEDPLTKKHRGYVDPFEKTAGVEDGTAGDNWEPPYTVREHEELYGMSRQRTPADSDAIVDQNSEWVIDPQILEESAPVTVPGQVPGQTRKPDKVS